MRIYPPDIVIEEDEGFTPKKDLFNRKEFGISLQNIFERVEDPLVVVLDEPWGMGKTTFIKMFAGHMRQNDFKVIYFDAFANDYAEGAFASLAGEIVAIAKKHCGATEPVKKFVESAVSVGKRLAPTLANVAIKALTLNTVSSEDAKEIISSASDTLGNFAQEQLKKAIEDHDARKSQREELREALFSIVKSLETNRDDQASDNASKPLIIIIDELDRCKPTYALDTIENIKHFFSIPGVHFLLVAHLEQLENSVRYSYGQNIDPALYLHKFYNFKTKFPDETKPKTNTKAYIDSIFNTICKEKAGQQQTTETAFLLDIISRATKMDYRTISKVATEYFLLLAQQNSKIYYEPAIVIGLCTIKTLNAKLFTRLANNKASLYDIAKELNMDSWLDNDEYPISDYYKLLWEYFLAPEEQPLPEELANFSTKLGHHIQRTRRYAITSICAALNTTRIP